ncbi:MAG: hypothetical protein AAGG53_12135 [Cyanobacteria bacterium P01_H01_bin.152]
MLTGTSTNESVLDKTTIADVDAVYFDVDYDVVWNTLQNDIPFLIRELETILDV